MNLKDKINKDRLPKHIAIIMDGNGRWATKFGKNRMFGHKNGVKTVRKIVEASGEIGLKYLTLYTFSTENWNRPPKEISALMDLLVMTIHKELKDLNKNNVVIKVIGDIDRLNKKIQSELRHAIDTTKNNTGLNLVMALSYSARWDIIKAIKKIVVEAGEGKVVQDDVSEDFVEKRLSTAGIPNPELLIRTSGEFRISNFLLWELAYSEMYFSEKFWPEFSKDDFYGAILDYQNRERRFGKVSEQL